MDITLHSNFTIHLVVIQQVRWDKGDSGDQTSVHF